MKLHGNVPVFIVCLIIAMLFWFFNASSKQYETIVHLPVKYINFPKDRVLKNIPPSRIPIEIRASGYNLIFNRVEKSIDTILVNAEFIREKAQGNETVASLEVKTLIKDVAKQMAGKAKVINVFADSIIFRFDRKVTKVLPVELNMDVSYAQQYMQSGAIKVLPAVVKLSGSASKMDSVSVLRTTPIRLKDIKEDVTLNAGFILVSNDSSFTTNPSQVLISVPVEQFTELSVEVPIQIVNVPDSMSIKLFPETATVTLNVGLSNYEQVSISDFLVEADFAKQVENSSGKLRVEVKRTPSFVNVVKLIPEKVEYILKKQ